MWVLQLAQPYQWGEFGYLLEPPERSQEAQRGFLRGFVC